MDLGWFVKNLRRSWRYRATVSDFARRMLWTYADKMPHVARRQRWEIGFRYREPIGTLQLVVRDNQGADAFILGEIFEHEYYSLPLSSPPSTILDLGANVGFSAIYFSRLYPSASLACVEPVPANLECLRVNLERNGVHAKVIDAAADVVDGRLWIELAQRDFGHKVAKSVVDGARERIQVEAISLPTLLRMLAWDRVGLLKIDIEGHEAKLLTENNEWLNRVDAICIECHEEMPEAKLFEVARQFDFLQPRNLRGVWLLSRAGPAGAEAPASSGSSRSSAGGVRL